MLSIITSDIKYRGVHCKAETVFELPLSIKDLGHLIFFLEIEVAHSFEGIFFSQRKYTLDILGDTGMLGSQPCQFSMAQNHGLTPGSGNPLTDPGITYPVQKFMQDPHTKHLATAYRVLHYLKGSPGHGILMSRSSQHQVQAYYDTDWATCSTTCRSVIGFLTFLGNSLLSWRSKKQSVVSRSSAEAESRSMANVVYELTWLKYLLHNMMVSHSSPMTLYCDNQAALHITSNLVSHEHTKHIELDCHLVHEKIQVDLIIPPLHLHH
jgi:hypothetical protein